ncbi:MAG: phosphodiester glycosidase family protein [Chitinophaga sp.]|uniref:phosphodiester glycosidase family protein n=1 Tax=Chitinophaga sp. TaxID=1869181 RepID=UPI001B1DF7C2|nr:phosphodiester glycosidase family protein [Chitinophaga sp.]MBO9732502.1 phosphodiester glycosidase family protein [Chitinophaga sp.]
MKVVLLALLSLVSLSSLAQDKIISYRVTNQQSIHFYWKLSPTQPFSTIEQLKAHVAAKKDTLVFAMNGGMFKPDYSPVGLYIRRQQVITPLNTTSETGNFGMQPNGVFYLTTENVGVVCITAAFHNDGHIRYATQSGPMLVIDGAIHPAFKAGSTNLNIRNGVGILPDGSVLFAISRDPINFYDFALFFKEQGCKNALYLDGAISQMYYPAKDMLQADGKFGVIIGVINPGAGL